MRDIMIDLETLSTRSDAAVISVGLVVFGPDGLGKSLYAVVNPKSVKGYIDVQTVAWWFKQPDGVRLLFEDPHVGELEDILTSVSGIVAGAGPNVRVWGHGSSFDLPILENQFKSVGFQVPWGHRAPRDTRTVYELAGVKVETPPDVKHNALADAKAQAEAVIRAGGILGKHLLWPELKV